MYAGFSICITHFQTSYQTTPNFSTLLTWSSLLHLSRVGAFLLLLSLIQLEILLFLISIDFLLASDLFSGRL